MSRALLIAASVVFLASVPAAAQPDTRTHTPGAARAERSAPQRAWDDLRWLMTALEAYATDNDSHYAPAGVPRDGVLSKLDQQLEWYYANTFPRRPSPPHVDPWGRQYHFVISETRKLYALYSLGPDGKLDGAAEAFLERLKKDQVTGEELQKPQTSRNVVVSGGLLFAPPEVLRTLRPAS
ncbi:MAG TPA: type II secretion system protein GspG [Thermoanaerobaculia bacterium]|nr:type II secretion system protein GspG [Thermoanaerobaculia bacterium]